MGGWRVLGRWWGSSDGWGVGWVLGRWVGGWVG